MTTSRPECFHLMLALRQKCALLESQPSQSRERGRPFSDPQHLLGSSGSVGIDSCGPLLRVAWRGCLLTRPLVSQMSLPKHRSQRVGMLFKKVRPIRCFADSGRNCRPMDRSVRLNKCSGWRWRSSPSRWFMALTVQRQANHRRHPLRHLPALSPPSPELRRRNPSNPSSTRRGRRRKRRRPL